MHANLQISRFGGTLICVIRMHSLIGIASPRGAKNLPYYIRDMSELFYPELSYTITGICFSAQNTLGRFAKERIYGDWIAKELTEKHIKFVRECPVTGTKDRVDFLVDNKIVVELKSKRYILKDDYYQTKRYLHAMNIKLALLINFQNRHLKPLRIVKSDRAPGAGLPTIEVGD